MLHALLPKATWVQYQLTLFLPVVDPHAVQRMVMINQNHPLAALATANQNLLHAVLATVIRNLQPVAQAKATASLKPLLVVPHAEPAESKIFNVPGHDI